MRFEIRLIGEETTSGTIFLHEVMERFDDAADAKRYAEIHCWDGWNGVCIVDGDTETVDFGDRVLTYAEVSFG